MANTFKAAFAQTPKTATVVTTAAASVATDAPAGTALLLTAGTNGAIVTRVSAMPRGTVTASSVNLWISIDGGVTQRLFDSVLMSAYTLAASTAIPTTSFALYSEATPLRLAAGDRIYVGNEVALAVGVVFKAEFTDF